MLGDSLSIAKELTPIREVSKFSHGRLFTPTDRWFAEPYTPTRVDERIRLRFADKSWQISRSPLWI
jgi:hypothetical protein